MIVFQLTEQISIDLMIYVKVFFLSCASTEILRWWHAKRFKSDLILKATFARRTLRVHKKILRTFDGAVTRLSKNLKKNEID